MVTCRCCRETVANGEASGAAAHLCGWHLLHWAMAPERTENGAGLLPERLERFAQRMGGRA